MGDQIYPGFELSKVDIGVDKEVMQKFLTDQFPDVKYRTGNPEIQILREQDAATQTVIVYGMLLPWRQIKERLGMNKLGNWLVRWNEGVFGLSKSEDLLSLEHDQLCQHLMEGMGNTPIMNLFTEMFNKEQLGSLKDISHTVRFVGKIIPGKEKMLENAGKVLQYRQSPSSSKTKYLDVEYMYRLEAVQALCLLSKNPDFSSDAGVFCTPKQCTSSAKSGLGQNGSIININSYMDILGYVPFAAFNSSIFQRDFLDYTTSCWTCGSDYKLLGLDGDLHFVAATCKCDSSNSPFAWNGQRFFRLIFSPFLCLKNSQENAHWDQYILQIQGLQSLYESISHFEKSAVAAEKMEFENNRRRLGMQHQVVGEVKSIAHAENVTVSGKEYFLWRIELVTKREGIWKPDGIFCISRCNLIPVDSENNSDDSKESRENRYGINNISGRVFNIIDQEDGHVVVVMVASLPLELTLKKDDKLWMVPRPPAVEQSALKRAISKWKAFDLERIEMVKANVPATITSALFLKTEPWNNEDKCVDVWEIMLDLGKHPYWQTMSSKNDDYLGADIELKVYSVSNLEKEPITAPARIVSVNKGDEQCFAIAHVLVSTSYEILPSSECYLNMWRGVQSKLETLPIPRGFEELDTDDEDAEHVSEMEKFVATALQKSGSQYEHSYIIDKPLADTELDGSTLGPWINRPKCLDLSLLDFMLQTNHPFISHHLEVQTQRTNVSAYPRYANALKTMQLIMNPTQIQALKMVDRNRLSIIHGPPGSGKSQLCVNAALHLLCVENGVVVIAAPSDYAADHLYATVLETMKSLKVDFRVMRMLSIKREHLQMQRGTELDTNYLHVAVRAHPWWDNIFDVDESLLTYSERKMKLNLIRHIEHDILSCTRVIVATVGATGDTRLDSLAQKLRDSDRCMSAIIVDEASQLSSTGAVPLLALEPKRIVLAGDNAQLSKLVANDSALYAGLDINWMTFLQMTPFVQESNIITILDQQYRMCSQIATVVSTFAYGGRMSSSSSVQDRKYDEDPRFTGLRTKLPELEASNIAIYTYDDKEAESPGSAFSFQNQKEVDITIALVRKLLEAGISTNDIVVIAMYDCQAKLLFKTAQKFDDLKGLAIGTSDSFQGKERSIVILNTVRSNPQNIVGFLRNKKRLVVGMSRAIDYLLFVGDTKTIEGCKISDLASLVSSMKASGANVITM